MLVTNRLGLPGAIVEAVKNDPYDAGECDITATTLIKPAQMVALQRQHAESLAEDAADRIWSLLGQAVHTILERAEPSAIVEERLYGTYGGWKVGMKFDRMTLRQHTLQDYKVTSAWTYLHGPKAEWIEQLNIGVQLAQDNGYPVKAAEIVSIYRDWSRMQAMRSADYPRQSVARVTLPVWPEERRRAFIEERVALHRRARELGEYPGCTDDERWKRGEAWALMKLGGKRALRVFDTEAAAKAALGEGQFIEHRVGTYMRCTEYCPVSAYCRQHNGAISVPEIQ